METVFNSDAALPARQMFPLSFTGTAGDYFRIWIANIALTLLTLGIYSAWAKVRKDASAGAARAGEYARHRPEQTLLYQLVETHYPAFVEHLAARERSLPAHVQREFEDYLKCGRLEHGFLRVRCADCHAGRLVAFIWPLLRIPARAAFVIPFTSQATWILSEQRCAPDGG